MKYQILFTTLNVEMCDVVQFFRGVKTWDKYTHEVLSYQSRGSSAEFKYFVVYLGAQLHNVQKPSIFVLVFRIMLPLVKKDFSHSFM